MKKLLALLLTLVMVSALASCNLGETPSSSTPKGDEPPARTDGSTPKENEETTGGTPSSSYEIRDYTVQLEKVPGEWQKAIGDGGTGMLVDSNPDFNPYKQALFSNASAEDFEKLIAYFDTLTYTNKKKEVLGNGVMDKYTYTCDWGYLSISYNHNNSDINAKWETNR